MAGLLDFLGTDDAKLGIALLSAGGYSPTPVSFGQRLGGALQNFQAQQTASEDRAMKKQLLQSQIGENTSQAEYRKQQAAAEAKKQAAQALWLQRFQGAAPGSTPPGLLGSASGGVVQNMTADDVAAARLSGLPDMTQLWQATRPDMVEVAPGMWADKKTIQPGVNQQAIAARTNDRIQQSDINMRGDFIDVEDSTGRKWKVPKSSLVGSPPPAAANIARPQTSVFAPPGAPPVDQSAYSQTAPGGTRDILTSELSKTKAKLQAAMQSGDIATAQRAQGDIDGLQRELGRLPGGARPSPVMPAPAMQGAALPAMPPSSGMPAGAIPSGMSAAEANKAAADKTYAEGVAKDQVEQRKSIMAAGFNAPTNIAKLKNIDKLLGDFDGGKLSQSALDFASAANSLGIKIDKNLPNKEAASALSNEIALSLRNPSGGAGMPGAMSDADRNFLAGMTPNMGQSAQGRKQLIAAKIAVEQRSQQVADAARKYEQKYGKLDNGFYSQLSAWAAATPMFGSEK